MIKNASTFFVEAFFYLPTERGIYLFINLIIGIIIIIKTIEKQNHKKYLKSAFKELYSLKCGKISLTGWINS